MSAIEATGKFITGVADLNGKQIPNNVRFQRFVTDYMSSEVDSRSIGSRSLSKVVWEDFRKLAHGFAVRGGGFNGGRGNVYLEEESDGTLNVTPAELVDEMLGQDAQTIVVFDSDVVHEFHCRCSGRRRAKDLDPHVAAFRSRALTSEHPYVWVDATYHKVRVDGRVNSQATVVAVGVATTSGRQLLGADVGPSEDRALWTGFLRSLVKRGLRGVRLVVSDAHEGLKQAINTALTGNDVQRCRVHFMRNLFGTVPKGTREPTPPMWSIAGMTKSASPPSCGRLRAA